MMKEQKLENTVTESTNTIKEPRDLSLDITRIVAFAFVPALHSFLHCGYYKLPILGTQMYMMTILRNFFMCCVPLFMVLSGYLMSSKEIKLEKKSILHFYFKLLKVIAIYLLATIAILMYKIFVAKDTITFYDCIMNILGYQQYSWYVNMYIGLYLLIPLLNAMWKAIGTKQGHLICVIILCVITIAPSIFNIYDFKTAGALLAPWTSKISNQIVPNWWQSIYPITYYFIGAYLKSHVDIKKLKTRIVFLLLICSVLIFGLYNILRSYSIMFAWGLWCDWGSLQNTVNTILVFLLINSINIRSSKKIVIKIFSLISSLTFGAYMLSYIPDSIFYPKLTAAVPEITARFAYSPLMVMAVILCSLLGSLVIYLIYRVFSFLIKD